MNLYLIKRTDLVDWDEYDGAVVAAENETDATMMHSYAEGEEWDGKDYESWSGKTISVSKIGDASPLTKAGVILASFNAG